MPDPSTAGSELICKHCEKPISGKYVIALGAHWHPDHFLCTRCRRRIREATFVVEAGKPYHPDCANASFAPRCGCCGQACLGEYIKDSAQVSYCIACWDKSKTCRHCVRLICANRVGCPVCASTAIVSMHDARRQFAFVLNWVGQQGVPLRWKLEDIELKL